MTTQPTEDQEPKTAAEQGDSADATGPEDQSSSQKPDATASEKPGETDGDGKDGDEVSTLRAELSAKDVTISQLQDGIGRADLKAQIDRYEADNRAADKADARSVEDGNMTAVVATDKSHERRDATQSKIEADEQKQRDYVQKRSDAIDTAIIARVAEGQGLAKEFGVDAAVLYEDLSLTTKDSMRNKARELQLDEREKNRLGTDVIDSGQRGAASINVEDMSGFEKVRAGLAKQK